jgi:hypothetical protein
MRFNDEQLRVAANLEVQYDAWMGMERVVRGLAYRLYWKKSNGHEYLIKLVDSKNNGTSLGPRSPDTESIIADYSRRKEEALARRESMRASLDTTCRLYRALRMPAISSSAAAVLREADAGMLLGDVLMVVGTNALAAYAIETGELFDTGLQATEDFDLAWAGGQATLAAIGPAPLLSMLKAVDSTYTRNEERPFQARNSKAYEVDVLIAPSLAAAFPPTEPLRPTPLPEQEWLLAGTRISHVVCALDGTPARVVAPDPRYFALQKIWLSEKPDRNPLKRRKDRAQGYAVLDALTGSPGFPLGPGFAKGLPTELAQRLHDWRSHQASPN